MAIVLKTLAVIVLIFFVVLWSTGNDVASFKNGLNHWADGRASSGSDSGDWGL